MLAGLKRKQETPTTTRQHVSLCSGRAGPSFPHSLQESHRVRTRQAATRESYVTASMTTSYGAPAAATDKTPVGHCMTISRIHLIDVVQWYKTVVALIACRKVIVGTHFQSKYTTSAVSTPFSSTTPLATLSYGCICVRMPNTHFHRQDEPALLVLHLELGRMKRKAFNKRRAILP
ncbi:hypothetical protein BCR34DRAFT_222927 [Clohesyomyces aquaticus]|uniref:Uncharacterized protein n=1 Tax=Clohesyomyces aquaticus TaxID=1231657 RepID=A0A1Y1ZWM3_9PLEO|nr:hypothetical protein BCR34DRAFT_222927 [Clohesyomyces aquaticus]